MPIRRRFANRSVVASASATTRVTIDPTVRQAIRSRSRTADFEQCVTSHAAVSSKAQVWPAPCLAHGTCAAMTPCSGQLTRGASASRNARIRPRSRVRHRRRPSPWSYPEQRFPQRPHRRLVALRGRTDTTRNCSTSSNSTSSTTTLANPSSPAHSLAERTPFPSPSIPALDSRNRRRGTACGASGPLRRPRKGHKSPNLASAAGSTGGVAGRLPSRRGLSPAPRSLRHHPSTAAPASRTQGVHLRCPMYSWNMSVGPSLAVSEARQQLASIIDRARAEHAPVYLARRGRRVAAVIDADDLDEILQLAEDMTDIRAAEAARAEMRTTGETPIPWEQVKADLGLT